MKYHDGSEARLGDVVTIPLPDHGAKARIVMLGDTGEHLDLDESFVEWVESRQLLGPDRIVVEWIGRNPFEHHDPQYAPVGNYMFLTFDECVVRDG